MIIDRSINSVERHSLGYASRPIYAFQGIGLNKEPIKRYPKQWFFDIYKFAIFFCGFNDERQENLKALPLRFSQAVICKLVLFEEDTNSLLYLSVIETRVQL